MRRGLLAFAAALFAALVILTPATAAPTTVTVDGQQPWTPTGFEVQPNEIIQIKATGMINYCDGGPRCNATPDGSTAGESHCGGPSLCGALIGRIAGGAPFAVGSDYRFSPQVSGLLELGINDFDDDPDGIFDNNTGSFAAEIDVVTPEIKGQIVDEKGNPIPGVRVEAKGSKGGGGATTSAYGRYAIRLSEPGTYTVVPESKDVQKFKPDKRSVKVAADKAGKADFQGQSKCTAKGKDEGPKSGFYPDSEEDGSTYSSIWYSCRSNRVVGRFITRDIFANNEIARITASDKLGGLGKGHFSFRDESGAFKFDGSFTSRSTVSWRVRAICDDTSCQFARRYHAKWDSDVDGSELGDGWDSEPSLTD